MERWSLILLSFLLLTFAYPQEEASIEAKRGKYIPSTEELFAEDALIRYKDYEVSGDKIWVKLDEERGVIEGNAVLKKGGELLRGKKLAFDWRNEKWEMEGGMIEVEPSRLQGASAPVFIYSARSEGSPSQIGGEGVSLTTCDLPHPHYYIEARKILAIIGDKLIARDVAFVVKGRRLLKLPYITIPLKPLSRRTIVPQVGNDPYEGFFIKSQYPYLATATQSGLLRLDYVERGGTGGGLEHTFTYPHLRSTLSLYQLSRGEGGGKNFSSRGDLEWKEGRWRASLLGEYQENSIWYGATRSTSLQTSLEKSGSKSRTFLGYRLYSSQGGYEREDRYASLLYDLTLAPQRGLQLNMETSDLLSFGGGRDKELKSTLRFHQEGRIGTEIVITRRDDLDKSAFTYDNFYFFLEKAPEINLRSELLGGKVPLNGEISWGRYRQMITQPFLSRFGLNLSTSLRKGSPSGGTSSKPFWNLTGNFFQGVYGDNTALYSLSLSASATLPLGASSLSLRLNHSESHGYSPFYMDQGYPYTTLNFNYLSQGKAYRWEVGGGYDFEMGYPFAILSSLDLKPSWGGMSLLFGYEPKRREWRDIIARIRVGQENPSWDVNIRYGVEKGKLGFLRGMGRLNFGGGWYLEGIFGYSGYRGKFDEVDLALTKDLHCWEAKLLYNKQRKEFTFNIYPKAFPILIRPMGIGSYGQMVGIGVGEYY